MKAKITITQFRRALWRVFSGFFFYSLLVLLIVMLLAQLSPVQTYLAQKVLSLISKQTNHEISINKVRISWLDEASMEDILIRDQEKDTLVYTNSLMVNYRILDLLSGDFLHLQEVEASKVRFKLTKKDSVSKLNLSIFLETLKKDTTAKESKALAIDKIGVSDLKLSVEDKSKVPELQRLDFAHLIFDISNIEVADLLVKKDTIHVNILQMGGKEQNSGFSITDFQTKMRISNQSLSVDDLVFATPTSYIADSLEFFYNGLDDFGHFTDSVSFILHFKNSKISQADLKILAGLDQVTSDITIDGIIWGTVGDFNIEDTRLGYGHSYFRGGVSCFGLPDISQTFILADITDSRLIPSDIEPYIGEYVQYLERMGKIDFNGSFAGFVKDFVARGDFDTDQGSVHTDINIKIPKDPTQMSYMGHLEFKDIHVGHLLKNQLVQKVNLKASIDGSGITSNNADFKLNALIYQTGLNGYIYDTIRADGEFAKNYFNGSYRITDPNCSLKGSGQIDLNQVQEVLAMKLTVEKFDALRLNLTTNDLTYLGSIDIEIKDLDMDYFTTTLAMDSGLLSLEDKRVVLDSIRFYAKLDEDSSRIIRLAFPGFESMIQGDFKISDVLKDIPAMTQGYTSQLQLHYDTTEMLVSGQRYEVDLNANIGNLQPYFDSLKVPISLGENTRVEATFRQSKNSNISFFIQSDSLGIGANRLYHPRLEINGSKEIGSPKILTNFILESTEQVISGMPNTKNLLLEGVWYDDHISLSSTVDQPETASAIRIQSSVDINKDSLVLKMLPSKIKLLNDHWEFNPSNQVVIKKDQMLISNFEIYESSESILIEGIYADSVPTSISIVTEDLHMDKAGLFSDISISGFLNGDFRIFRKSSNEPFKFDGGFLLKNLAYDDLMVGDVSGSSTWDPIGQSIYTNVLVERKNIKAVQVEGYYYPLQEKDQLDFEVKFDDADLVLGQPFLKDNFSKIGGYASGTLKLTGSIDHPNIVGSCQIEDGNVNIDYINTNYNFDGEIAFDPTNIRLVNFDLTDRKGSRAVVSGIIHHTGFINFISDIQIVADNFEFLNTTSLDNNLYYGSAYGTGTINVTGPLDDLNIAANIRTEADTRFFVPISDGTSINQEEYISFADFRDTLKVVSPKKFNISGLTLDFDIEVTPDAYCELIFDIKTGDIIRGRGRGNLKLRMNTDGEFNMFGPLEITEGAYNFTMANIINKEFDVVPGSKITWYGDPYNATLDLDATYLQKASFEELKNPEEQDKAELSKKVPILVVLSIERGMLSPQIDFDLELQNPADATQTNIPLLSQITNDEQELKRQVISLLFLKRFSPKQSFTLSGGGSVGNSVSEFLSSQVSYLVSQIDENLEVEVNLADLSKDAFNTFQLRFAYTFLNGRLRVTRGGTFGNQNNANSNVLNDIVGDWSVEYSLTKDGRLRAKVFRNTNQRILINENQQNQETGLSLRFVHSFNDLSQLLTMKRNEVIEKRKEAEGNKNKARNNPESQSLSTGGDSL